MVAVALAVTMLGCASQSEALITPPVTVDGPSSSIFEFGGVAMAEDGTGGVTYVRSVGGVPHVFACRFVGGQWGPPVRVDWDQPYPASQPRISAGVRGELLVVWVTEVATVHGEIQDGLYSASVGRGAEGFGPSQLVDPDVGEGIGVDPSLSATAPGQAIVAYRAITETFNPRKANSTAVELRKGDVMADIRVARLKEDRWSRLGAINRNPEASMRPPTPTNAPQVATGVDGSAAVIWQEPDQTGTARVWMRRIFGTTPGPVLEASPAVWEGKPVTADADAFSLAVSKFAQVRVAVRFAPENGSPLAGALILNSLRPNFSLEAGVPTGPVLADGGDAAGRLGLPGVAADDEGGTEGSLRLGFLAGTQLRQMDVDQAGKLTVMSIPPGPPAQAGGEVVTAVNPAGGGLVAYPAFDSTGRPAVAVRQEAPSGSAETGLVQGDEGGPVADLAIGRSGEGDGLIGFLQGEPGRYQVVVDEVGAAPKSFRVTVPARWVKPREAKIHWEAAPSGVGGLRYAVLLGGHVVRSGLKRLVLRPRPALLGSGAKPVRVQATDRLGQQLLSKPTRLRVDSEAPVVRVDLSRSGRRAVVTVTDSDSGVKGKRTRVSFGDGTPWARPRPSGHTRSISRSIRRGRGRKRPPAYRLAHVYGRAGRYEIAVQARDLAGNSVVRHFEVRAR